MKKARKKIVDLAKVKTYPLRWRKSKVSSKFLAATTSKGIGFNKFLAAWPKILAAQDFQELVAAVVKAKQKAKPVILLMGAHIIKCGLSPLVIDLLERGVIKAVALNGAGVIHDSEMAMIGQTSEDVARGLKHGSFGMARQTAEFINEAVNQAQEDGLGLGFAVGEKIEKGKLPFRRLSILACAYRLQVPVTVHVAIGTDIIHQHPSFSGASCGETSFLDFKELVGIVSELGNGGVVLNFGSAVILPEVFLKALNLARNLGAKVKNFTTANFDMYTHYRPWQNVVKRPTQDSGKGYNFIGHHEIMFPLFYQAILEKLN
jgi:hypothetical protein